VLAVGAVRLVVQPAPRILPGLRVPAPLNLTLLGEPTSTGRDQLHSTGYARTRAPARWTTTRPVPVRTSDAGDGIVLTSSVPRRHKESWDRHARGSGLGVDGGRTVRTHESLSRRPGERATVILALSDAVERERVAIACEVAGARAVECARSDDLEAAAKGHRVVAIVVDAAFGASIDRLRCALGAGVHVLAIVDDWLPWTLAGPLAAGADDVVGRPCGPFDLAARVFVATWRGRAATLRAGALVVDKARREVKLGTKRLELRPRDFDVPAGLVDGGPVTSGDLWRRIGGWGSKSNLWFHVTRLRKALAPHGLGIERVSGGGYRVNRLSEKQRKRKGADDANGGTVRRGAKSAPRSTGRHGNRSKQASKQASKQRG